MTPALSSKGVNQPIGISMLQALLLTGLGGLLAIGGALVGHYVQAEEARKVRAETRQREDFYRFHADRKAAYASCYQAFTLARETIFWLEQRPDDTDLGERLRLQFLDAHDAFTVVKLIGSPEAAEAVGPLMQAISSAALTGTVLDKEAWGQHMGVLLRTTRGELLSPRE
jgi:hypothetical protein